MKIYLTPLALIALIAPLHSRSQSNKNIKTAIASAKTELKQSHAQAINNQKALRSRMKHAKKSHANLMAQMRGNQSIITIIDRTLSHFRIIEQEILKDLDRVIAQHQGKIGQLDKELRQTHRQIQKSFKELHKKPTNAAHQAYKGLDQKHTQLTIDRDVHTATLNTLKKIKASQH